MPTKFWGNSHPSHLGLHHMEKGQLKDGDDDVGKTIVLLLKIGVAELFEKSETYHGREPNPSMKSWTISNRSPMMIEFLLPRYFIIRARIAV